MYVLPYDRSLGLVGSVEDFKLEVPLEEEGEGVAWQCEGVACPLSIPRWLT